METVKTPLHLAKVAFSPELLLKLLHLPDNAQIKGANYTPNEQFSSENVILFIEHPDLPLLDWGVGVQQVEYKIITREAPEDSRPFIKEFGGWMV